MPQSAFEKVKGETFSALCYHGNYFDDPVRIPLQTNLMQHLLKRQDDKPLRGSEMTPTEYAGLCLIYEEYLFVCVNNALEEVMRNPKTYNKHRYIQVHVDLEGNGSSSLPFHLAHYGLQRQDKNADTDTGDAASLYWSRRNKNSWMICGIPLPPFRFVQHKLKEIGYYLVDMSFMGIGTHFRLYYRGHHPTNKDYIAHVRRKYKNVSAHEFVPKHYFWHGMHEHDIPEKIQAHVS